MGELNSLGVIRAKVVKVNVTNRQTPMGEIVKARDAREMKTIQGNRGAKYKRNGAEASSAEQIMIEYK